MEGSWRIEGLEVGRRAVGELVLVGLVDWRWDCGWSTEYVVLEFESRKGDACMAVFAKTPESLSMILYSWVLAI